MIFISITIPFLISLIGLKYEYITTFYLRIQHFISSDIYSNCISNLLLVMVKGVAT